MDIWLSSSECAGLPGLPGTPQGLTIKRERGNGHQEQDQV